MNGCYYTNILACPTSKQLYNVTNTLLCKSDSSSLPSTVHPSRLPRAFTDFFASKIDTIRHSLNTDSTSLLTCNDPQFLSQPLTAFDPVSEDTVKNVTPHQALWAWPSSSFLLQSVSWHSSSLHCNRCIQLCCQFLPWVLQICHCKVHFEDTFPAKSWEH